MRKIKDFVLKRLGIAQLRERTNSAQNKIKELEKKNQSLQKEKIEMMHRISDLEKLVYMNFRGLNTTERTPRLIVSLTSFPARISYVPQVLERMLAQTVKPDEIVLWLSKEQFPLREAELPDHLLKLKDYGVKIEWCDGDVKAYKKFLPAFKKYPDDLLVILDDDLIYHTDHLEKLYEAHKNFPDAIIASRVHEIAFDENGKIAPYKAWKKECDFDTHQLRDGWFYTGGAGTLFPPHIFGKEMFELDVIQQLCPWADDIWLNIQAAMNHVPIVNISTNAVLRRIEGTQEVCLEHINIQQQQNDVQLKNVVMHYREKLAGTIYEKM